MLKICSDVIEKSKFFLIHHFVTLVCESPQRLTLFESANKLASVRNEHYIV